MLIGFLTSVISASNHTKCVLLSLQKCMTQPTLINYVPMSIVKNYITIPLRLN